MIRHFSNASILMFIFLVESIDVTGPGVSVSVSPGQNLWVGEDLILECRSRVGRDELVVWHRLVASEMLGEAGGGTGAAEEVGADVAELLSHGDTLLLSDQRFSLHETQFEDSSVYRLKIKDVKVSDSGKYECQVVDMDQQKDESQHIQIDIYHNQNNNNNNNVEHKENMYTGNQNTKKNGKQGKGESSFKTVIDYNIDTEYLGDSIVVPNDSDDDHHQIVKQQSLISTKSEELRGLARDINKRQSKQQREVSNSAFYSKFSITLLICLYLIYVIE